MRCGFIILTPMHIPKGALLTRLHYSIDVFAAYFITYAVYRFERRRLRRPYRRLRHAVFARLLRSPA